MEYCVRVSTRGSASPFHVYMLQDLVPLPPPPRLFFLSFGCHPLQPEARSFNKGILEIQRDLQRMSLSNLPWNRVVFNLPDSLASQLLINAESWDMAKRNTARRVMHKARNNFHSHPRQWYALTVAGSQSRCCVASLSHLIIDVEGEHEVSAVAGRCDTPCVSIRKRHPRYDVSSVAMLHH